MAVLRSTTPVLWLGTWALAAVALAEPPAADLTGEYAAGGRSAGTLTLLQGDNETLAYFDGTFPQGQSVGICQCPLVLQQRKSPELWILKSTDSADLWTLRVEPGRLVLASNQDNPDCCGANWPGVGPFERSSVKPPQSCKVKAPRAWFHASDEQHTQRKAYVVAGDQVQAYVSGNDADFVPGRFKGPKSALVGQLKLAELDCREPGASQPSTAATPADKEPSVGPGYKSKRQDEEDPPAAAPGRPASPPPSAQPPSGKRP